MARSDKAGLPVFGPPDSLSPNLPPRLHRAARIEDAFHAFRANRARKRGLLPTVIPYSGYGGDGWVRVLGRVLLGRARKTDSPGKPRNRSVRGWRSFTSVPAGQVDVIVTVGGTDHRVRADRGG